MLCFTFVFWGEAPSDIRAKLRFIEVAWFVSRYPQALLCASALYRVPRAVGRAVFSWEFFNALAGEPPVAPTFQQAASARYRMNVVIDYSFR